MTRETLEPFIVPDAGSKACNSNVLAVYGEVPRVVPDKAYLSIVRTKANGFHNLGNPQPAKFIPEIPRWAIRKFSETGKTILDPFVGSGTTLAEARILGRNSYGIDHNPLSRLIAKVKSTPLQYDDIVREKRKLENAVAENIGVKEVKLPVFKNRDFWFDQQASEGIAIVRESIERETTNENIRDFFFVVLSETIRRVSKVGSGQILPATRSKKREKTKVTRKDVYESFFERLKDDIVKIREFSSQADKSVFATIIGDDARKISVPSHVDLIITSPPYINSHHYIWTNKLRLLQLKLLDDEERLQLMRKEIGSEELSSREYEELGVTGIAELDKKIKQIYVAEKYRASGNQNKIRARSVFEYFCDMKKHLTEAFRILKKDSHYVLVIGTNKICKVEIPTGNILVKIAEEIGFRKVLQFQILLKNRTLNLPRNVPWADTTPYDHVIVFEHG